MMTPDYIYGMHDPGGEFLFADRKGWIVFTEEIGHDPNNGQGKDYSEYSDQGFGVIVRLNNGYGSSGTIPLPEHYGDFARRCARYVRSSKGCARWIIGNEPNHHNEWPEGKWISPQQYAACFGMAEQAIHAEAGHRSDEVIAAAIAPWTDQTGIPGFAKDWLIYGQEMLSLLDRCDGIALHAYTNGASPALITSTEKMQPPYQDRNYQFWAYRDTLQRSIPSDMRDLPVYMTEMAQIVVVGGKLVGWLNINSGWIKAAYGDIDYWNSQPDTQKIHCGCLYRWPNADVWGLVDRTALHVDLRGAVAEGYKVPKLTSSLAKNNVYLPYAAAPAVDNTTPPTTDPLPPIEWDERLTQRQIELTPYQPRPGEWYWRIVKGEYWEEKEHTFAVTLDKDGNRFPGVLMRFWNGGNLDKVTELKPNDRWMVDFPMFAHGRSYGLKVVDGPSDSVFGMGLGSVEQPDWNIHVSYRFIFQWTQAPTSRTSSPPSPLPEPTPQPRYALNDELYTVGYVNLRRTPGYVGKSLDDVNSIIGPGKKVVVKDGPKIVDGLVWWYVIDNSMFRLGWVAENDPTGSLLVTEKAPEFDTIAPILSPPVGNAPISQPFGVNEEYYKQFVYDGVPLLGHNGIDFAVPVGTPVAASDSGQVLQVSRDTDGFGLHMLVHHEWGDSLYAHLSEVKADAIGSHVNRGQVIALSGNTGTSSGPHLHFGIRLTGYSRGDGYGGYTDPVPYLLPDDLGIKEMIVLAAREMNVDADVITSMAYAESRYDVAAMSEVGASGLMQIMPATWNEWAPRANAKNIWNPLDNLRVGAMYLRWLLGQFDGDTYKALCAYNWGIDNMHKVGTPPLVTQLYARSIIHGSGMLKAIRDL